MPHRAEEVADNAIEARDLRTADLRGVTHFLRGRAVPEFLRFALQKLQVNANGVQGIADFMRDTRSEGDDGVDALAFNAVLSLHALSGDVAQDGNAAGPVRILRTTHASEV